MRKICRSMRMEVCLEGVKLSGRVAQRSDGRPNISFYLGLVLGHQVKTAANSVDQDRH